jgi:hypothetical protein
MGIKTIGTYTSFGEYIRDLRLNKNVGFIKLTSNVSELDTVRWSDIERDIVPPSCEELLAVAKYLYPEKRLQALSSLIEAWQDLVYETKYIRNYVKEAAVHMNLQSDKYKYSRNRVAFSEDNQSQDNSTKPDTTKEVEIDMCPVTGSVTMFNQQSDDNKHECVEKSVPTERYEVSWIDDSSASKLSSFMSSIETYFTTGDIIDCIVTTKRLDYNQWKVEVEVYSPVNRWFAATDILADTLVSIGTQQVYPAKCESSKVGEVVGKFCSDSAPPNSSLWWSGEQH